MRFGLIGRKIMFFVFAVLVALVNTQSVIAETAEEYYIKGSNAYNKKDCIDALKYLSAYKAVMEQKLKNDPVGSKELDNAINGCEKTLRALINPSNVSTDGNMSRGKIKSGGTLMPR